MHFFEVIFCLEQKIQQMIKNLNEFGLDAQSILDFSDTDLLEKVHNAIEEYRKNKNGLQSNDSIW